MAILFIFFNTSEVECFNICLLINHIFSSELPVPFLCSFDFLYKGKKMMSYWGKPLFLQALWLSGTLLTDTTL